MAARFSISLACVLAICGLSLFTLTQKGGAPLLPEKRRAAVMPAPGPGYLKGLGNFMADNLPLRQPLLALAAKFHEVMHMSADPQKALAGKDGWLYLGDDFASTITKLTGPPPAPELVQQRLDAYNWLRLKARERGASFYLFICPDKPSIYPEYLPPQIRPASQRYLAPLMARLRAEGLHVYDAAPDLLAAKSEGNALYWRTDTHWNRLGAWKAWQGFLKYAGLPAPSRMEFYPRQPCHGDLLALGGFQGLSPGSGDNFGLAGLGDLPEELRPKLTCEEAGTIPSGESDSDETLAWGRLLANPHSSSGKTAWIFGDSFSWALRPYMGATFRKIRFFAPDDYFKALASDLPSPDLVIWITVERHVI